MGMVGDDVVLEDVFYELMEFGIVGMWGVFGFGINWMNIYMVC